MGEHDPVIWCELEKYCGGKQETCARIRAAEIKTLISDSIRDAMNDPKNVVMQWKLFMMYSAALVAAGAAGMKITELFK